MRALNLLSLHHDSLSAPNSPRSGIPASIPHDPAMAYAKVAARAAGQAQIGQWKAALALFDGLLRVHPQLAAAWNDRGKILWNLRQFDHSIGSFEKAFRLRPDFADAYANHANALVSSRPTPEPDRLRAALRSYDKALELGISDPAIEINRANVLASLGRLDEALAAYTLIEPEGMLNFQVRYNQAGILQRAGRFAESLTAYDRAVAIDPQSVAAHIGRAALLLRLGRMREGWSELEWRRLAADSPHIAGIPNWQGSDPRGKAILVYAEQGLGDTIQFARFATQLAAAGASVILRIKPELRRLLAGLKGVSIQNDTDPVPACDFAVPLMSLPVWFPNLDGGAYLTAEPDRVTRIAACLPSSRQFRIGIAWQGNPRNTLDKGRSIPLSEYLPLTSIPGVSLISLQKHAGIEQLRAADRVHSLGEALDAGTDAFLDTAAAMMHLDLIITSDTAIAHLAGALGRPVWIALQKVPDWRWMAERDDSPWYPTARLFRQNEPGDWADVFSRIAAALRSTVSPVGERSAT